MLALPETSGKELSETLSSSVSNAAAATDVAARAVPVQGQPVAGPAAVQRDERAHARLLGGGCSSCSAHGGDTHDASSDEGGRM